MTVAHTFVYAPAYDMATCLAMFTNLSSTIIFISRVEMHFHERYKAYSEAVIGGRWEDINNAKNRMFRQLASELMNLVRIQFIVSVVLYLLCVIFLPGMGFSGLVMQIYLYYFNDMTGALLTAVCFCLGTFFGTLFSKQLPDIWYGAGLVMGSFFGFTVGYFRLRWVERHMDVHIFCQGELFKIKRGRKPSAKSYDRKEGIKA